MIRAHIIYTDMPTPEAIAELLARFPILDITWERFDGNTAKLPIDRNPYNGMTHLDWVWHKSLFKDRVVDIRCFLTTARILEQNGIKDYLGLYELNTDRTHDFYIGLPTKRTTRATANGFVSDFARIFIHEYLHGVVYFSTGSANECVQIVHEEEARGQLLPLLARHVDLYKSLEQRLTLIRAISARLSIITMDPHLKLYENAVLRLGTDVSPRDLAPDELGCAETASNLIMSVWPNMPVITGTYSLLTFFQKNPQRFEKLLAPERGAIIINATGTGNGSLPGHVGVCDGDGGIISNNSPTGTLERNFTDVAWKQLYVTRGGMPTYYFKIK